MQYNQIFNESCLETMARIADKEVDLVVTDPPYNVGKSYGEETDDNRSKEDYYNWLSPIWKEVRRISKGVLITPGTVNFYDFAHFIEKPKWTCIWIKSNQCSRNAYRGANVWEPILCYGELGNGKGSPLGQDAWYQPIKKQKDVKKHPVPKLLEFWDVLVEKAPPPRDWYMTPS